MPQKCSICEKEKIKGVFKYGDFVCDECNRETRNKRKISKSR